MCRIIKQHKARYFIFIHLNFSSFWFDITKGCNSWKPKTKIATILGHTSLVFAGTYGDSLKKKGGIEQWVCRGILASVYLMLDSFSLQPMIRSP